MDDLLLALLIFVVAEYTIIITGIWLYIRKQYLL